MRELPVPDALSDSVASLEAGLIRASALGRLRAFDDMERAARAAAARWDAAGRARFRTARAEGRREGRDAGAAETAAALRALRDRLDALEAELRGAVTDRAIHAVRLILAEMPGDALIGGAVRKALADNPTVGGATLRVPPARAEAHASYGGIGEAVEIVADRSVPARTAILETPLGTLELGESAMIEAARALLTGAMDAPGAGPS